MGFYTKIQRVDRGKAKSFYINLPVAIAEACNILKGEEMEWLIEDRNIFILKRVNPAKSSIRNTKLSPG